MKLTKKREFWKKKGKQDVRKLKQSAIELSEV